jgi:membrane protease YdiL (CAAX protease family)
MVEYREEKDEKFSPTMQMGIIVILITVSFLFMGLSGQKMMTHNIYYLLMFFGSVFACYIIYRDEIGEKLHFTTQKFPLTNVIIYGVMIGIVMVAIEGLGMMNSVIVEQSMTASVVGQILQSGTIVGVAIAYSFTTAVSEETLTRGALNSIAENYSSGYYRLVGKYVVIPLIFALLHYFMWLTSGLFNVGWSMAVFLIIYHYTFGFVCQVSMDITGSIYTPIAIHTVYNALKSLIGWGIITWGQSMLVMLGVS